MGSEGRPIESDSPVEKENGFETVGTAAIDIALGFAALALGGGGGSYATASAVSHSDAPVAGRGAPPSPTTGGGVVITFDFCAYDDTLPVCTQ